EIGLDRRHAGGLERLVEVDLLGRLRLRLHCRAGAGTFRDVEDDRPGFLGTGRVVHVPAARLDVADQSIEVLIERLERGFLDLARVVAEAVAVRQRVERLAAQADELRRRDVERLLEEAVAERLPGALAERRRENRRVRAPPRLTHPAQSLRRGAAPAAASCAARARRESASGSRRRTRPGTTPRWLRGWRACGRGSPSTL